MPSTDTSTTIPCRSSSCCARSARAAAIPTSTTGGRRSVMKVRTSSSPLRSMSRRNATSAWADGSMWLEDAVEVLDLEDGVGQDLGRPVVDVLGHALSLALLGLDDPQAHGGGRVVGHRAGLVDRLVGRVEVAPQHVQLAGDDVEPLQPGLQCGKVSAALLVLGAKRIGPDRSERTPAAVEPRAELHPLLEVPPVLLAELLGQLVHAARVATEALRGLGADAVEAGWARCPSRDRLPSSPLSTGSGLVPDEATMLSASCAYEQQYFGHRKYYRRRLRVQRTTSSRVRDRGSRPVVDDRVARRPRAWRAGRGSSPPARTAR